MSLGGSVRVQVTRGLQAERGISRAYRVDTTLLGRQRGRRKRRGFLLRMGNLVADTGPNLLEPLFFGRLLPQRPFPPLLMFRKLESFP